MSLDRGSVTADLADVLSADLMDVADLYGTDLVAVIQPRIAGLAARLAGDLTGTDPAVAARTAAELLHRLGDADDPAWWATPLGVAIGLVLGDSAHASGFTRRQAAVVLGVSDGTVSQLTARGTLPAHPSGRGISQAATFQRAARRSGAH